MNVTDSRRQNTHGDGEAWGVGMGPQEVAKLGVVPTSVNLDVKASYAMTLSNKCVITKGNFLIANNTETGIAK